MIYLFSNILQLQLSVIVSRFLLGYKEYSFVCYNGKIMESIYIHQNK